MDSHPNQTAPRRRQRPWLRAGILVALAVAAAPFAYQGFWIQRLRAWSRESTDRLCPPDRPLLKFLVRDLNPAPTNAVLGLPREPWHVWKTHTDSGAIRWIVFSGQELFQISGTSSASILLLSPTGRRLGGWAFSTGWRIDLDSANCRFDTNLGAPVVTLHTGAWVNGRDVARQVFAVADDQLRLIRLEDSRGNLIRNDYAVPHWTLGGELPTRDTNQWRRFLESDRAVDQLTALTYLGGLHRLPVPQNLNTHSETLADAQQADGLRRHPATKARIDSLLAAPHPWVRAAAAACLPEPEKLDSMHIQTRGEPPATR